MKQEKIVFQNSNKQKLVGILYSSDPKEKSPIVIFCHGYRSTKESSKIEPLAKNLVSNKISLFAFDFSGSGESEGKFEDITITQYIDDLKCVIDYLSKFTNKIAVIGSSLGGIVTLQEAAKDKRVKIIILLSPVSSFPYKGTDEFSSVNLKKWKEEGYTFTQSNKFGKLKINYSFYEDGIKYRDYSVYESIKIPTLIIHGDEDPTVSIKDSKKLVEYLKNSELIIIKGADHSYTKEKDFNKMIKDITNFVIKGLK